MAQTERSWAAIEAILADNTTGDISPVDLRDAMGSSLGGYCGLDLTPSGAPVALNGVSTTPILINVYDEIQAQSIDTNLNGASGSLASGSITFGSDGIYQVNFFAAFTSSQNNVVTLFSSFINGVTGLPAIRVNVGTGADVGSVAAGGIFVRSSGDIFDSRVSIDSGSTNLTFESLSLSVFRVG